MRRPPDEDLLAGPYLALFVGILVMVLFIFVLGMSWRGVASTAVPATPDAEQVLRGAVYR